VSLAFWGRNFFCDDIVPDFLLAAFISHFSTSIFFLLMIYLYAGKTYLSIILIIAKTKSVKKIKIEYV